MCTSHARYCVSLSTCPGEVVPVWRAGPSGAGSAWTAGPSRPRWGSGCRRWCAPGSSEEVSPVCRRGRTAGTTAAPSAGERRRSQKQNAPSPCRRKSSGRSQSSPWWLGPRTERRDAWRRTSGSRSLWSETDPAGTPDEPGDPGQTEPSEPQCRYKYIYCSLTQTFTLLRLKH